MELFQPGVEYLGSRKINKVKITFMPLRLVQMVQESLETY